MKSFFIQWTNQRQQVDKSGTASLTEATKYGTQSLRGGIPWLDSNALFLAMIRSKIASGTFLVII